MNEEREEGGPASKTTLSGEHGHQSKAKSPEQQERADSPGPSCVSMKSDWSMDHPPDLKNGRPSREKRWEEVEEEEEEVDGRKEEQRRRTIEGVVDITKLCLMEMNQEKRGDLFAHQEMDGKTKSSCKRILLEPYKYLLQLPGKQLLIKLSRAFNHWFNVPEDKLQVIMEVTKMLRNASLLIDDIEDNSTLRRGCPAAHSIYGMPSVINSANYIYFLSLKKVLTLEHPEAVHVFTRQLLELHRGQGLDIHWRDTYTCPSEQEYCAMAMQKTGGLLDLVVGLMQLFSSWGHDLKPLLDTLGLFFQICDDYANLRSQEYSESKSFGNDLTEGKFSFPAIHAIWSQPESTQVQNILRQRTDNIYIKRYCVDYLEKVGSFAYTRQTLRSLEADTCRLIEELGGNPELEGLVKYLGKMYQEDEAGSKKPASSQTH